MGGDYDGDVAAAYALQFGDKPVDVAWTTWRQTSAATTRAKIIVIRGLGRPLSAVHDSVG